LQQSAVVLDGRVYLFGGRLLSEIPDLSPPYGGLITFDSGMPKTTEYTTA